MAVTVRTSVVELEDEVFTLVEVPAMLLSDATLADATAQLCTEAFPQWPIVLVATIGTARMYHGRKDLAEHARNTNLAARAWLSHAL